MRSWRTVKSWTNFWRVCRKTLAAFWNRKSNKGGRPVKRGMALMNEPEGRRVHDGTWRMEDGDPVVWGRSDLLSGPHWSLQMFRIHQSRRTTRWSCWGGLGDTKPPPPASFTIWVEVRVQMWSLMFHIWTAAQRFKVLNEQRLMRSALLPRVLHAPRRWSGWLGSFFQPVSMGDDVVKHKEPPEVEGSWGFCVYSDHVENKHSRKENLDSCRSSRLTAGFSFPERNVSEMSNDLNRNVQSHCRFKNKILHIFNIYLMHLLK